MCCRRRRAPSTDQPPSAVMPIAAVLDADLMYWFLEHTPVAALQLSHLCSAFLNLAAEVRGRIEVQQLVATRDR